jgi:Cdc6-like AAA superfamily ATPase
MVDPEIGFTSGVIRDPQRFIGRTNLIRNCIQALNSPLSVIAVYGKRGVGKSSLLRQVQQIALGDYTLPRLGGLSQEVPKRPRTFLTIYYSCDAMIKSGADLISRLINDQDDEDGLLRLVPNDGKQLVEFSRAKELGGGTDLKVVNWGVKGVQTSKYAKVVPEDTVQTFRNFVSAVITHQVRKRMKRDGLLVLLDEFDVISDKDGLGSLIKSLSSSEIKFGICGIARDLFELVEDHASVERLLEQGAILVEPMPGPEIEEIFSRAEQLFKGEISFESEVKRRAVQLSHGYPYLAQLIGKACVQTANRYSAHKIDSAIFKEVTQEIKDGSAFPTLEQVYQRAIGNSGDRQLLLHLLAEQPEGAADVGRIVLKKTRKDAAEFDIQYIDQLLPRLLDRKYGPVLARVSEKPGIYEFVNPVFRIYVRLRRLT